MKPAPFDYEAPETLEETLELLRQHGDDAKILAGGQSLVPAMNFRLAQPAVLVDVNGVEGLDFIRESDEGLELGALVRQRAAERSPLVSKRCPLLREALPWVAHPQIRNRGTVGGSLAHADPAAELPAVMLALGAKVEVRSSSGARTVAAEDFSQGLFETALEPEEMLTSVRVPSAPPGTGSAFVETSRRSGDFALVGVAVLLRRSEGVVDHCRIALLSVADQAVLAGGAMARLMGTAATPDDIREAAAIAAADDIDPLGDLHASPAFRRHLAGVLVRRALELALDRTAS